MYVNIDPSGANNISESAVNMFSKLLGTGINPPCPAPIIWPGMIIIFTIVRMNISNRNHVDVTHSKKRPRDDDPKEPDFLFRNL